MGTQLKEVIDRPNEIVADLVVSQVVFGLVNASVVRADPDLVTLYIELRPWPPMAREGYPVERLGLVIQRSGATYVFPHAVERRWNHLYRLADLGLGYLCLWYPRDPQALRWSWSDGLESLLSIVHRHLMGEEYWRRNGVWPWEDAPHGDEPKAAPHPIRTATMAQISEQWER